MWKLAFTAGSLVMLVACGGGSSSESGSGSGNGSGGTTPIQPPALTINGNNAEYIATISMLSMDALLSFGQLTVLAHDELNNKPLRYTGERQPFCRNEAGRGNVIQHSTNDNFYLGPNQRFSIQFINCELAELEGMVTGILDVTVRNVTIDTYALEMTAAAYQLQSSSLVITDEEGSLSLSLNNTLNYAASETRYFYEMSANDVGMTLTLPDNKVERWRNLTTSVEFNLVNNRYQVQTQGTLQSELLGGNVNMSTVTPFGGKLQRLPSQGEYRFQATGNNTLLLSSVFRVDGYQAVLTLPELGLQGAENWQEYTTGASWQKTGLAKPYVIRPLTDFVNLDFERLGPGVPLEASVLPNQDLILYFSDVINEISSWSNTISLRSVNEEGFSIFGVPDIPVSITVQGSMVKIRPETALRNGIRYRFDGFTPRSALGNTAQLPAIYVQVRNELSLMVNSDDLIMRAGSPAEFYTQVEANGVSYQTEWRIDNGISSAQGMTQNRLTANFQPLNQVAYRLGEVTATVTNQRGNSISTTYPYIVLAPEVSNYHYAKIIGMDKHLVSRNHLQQFNINEDIGNATGTNTGVSGQFDDGVFWGISVRTSEDDRLQPGTYELSAATHATWPSFELTGINKRCTPQRGQFTVIEAEYADDLPFVTALTLSYDYECLHNQDRYRYRGQLSYKRGF